MPESHTNRTAADLLVELDRDSSTPVHVQLEVMMRDAIRSGRLAADSAVPASRRLAEQLGLSRGVVVEAYQQLTAEGYLISRPGGYTRVAGGVRATEPAAEAAPDAAIGRAVDFRYGRPDVSQFPREAWLRSVRTVLIEAPHDRLNYLDGRGAIELRTALADYLNRVRGTWAEPGNVIACNGFAQAVALILPVLAAHGMRRLAVEDPSDDGAVRVAREAGFEVVGIPVTPDGIDVAALEASGADVVLVTPAHQFPTGCVMSPDTRTALLAWATSRGGLIIEDDYDAEYRYDQAPVGALHGLAPDNVIYAGTTSKTLAPGLRLGWLVAPTRPGRRDRGAQGGGRPWLTRHRSARLRALPPHPESSTGICAGCGPSTAGGATTSSAAWGSTLLSSRRSASPPGCTSSRGSRQTFPSRR